MQNSSDIIILENLFDDFINNRIISELRNVKWILSGDTLDNEYSDAGFLHYSFNNNKPPHEQISRLNLYGELICQKVMEQIPDLQSYWITRFLWNYYNRSSTGTFHPDEHTDNFLSIVYYVNTCDGGTMIGDTFVKSESGTAVIFPSKTLHRGIGPTKDPNRYVLNILLYKE